MNAAAVLATTTHRWLDRTSLAGRLRRTFTLIASLVAAAFLVTAFSFGVVWGWLLPDVDRCRQLTVAATALHGAALDEETGARGYLLTGDPAFLEPYRRGRDAFVRNYEALQATGASVPAIAIALSRTRDAESMWQRRWAEPALASTALGTGPSVAEGKVLFDALRAEQSNLEGIIAEQTQTLYQRARTTVGVRVALDVTIVLALLLVVLRQHRSLRAWIVVPVAHLLRNIERVRDGNLLIAGAHAGPTELRDLGSGLDDMVRALVVARDTAESQAELLRAGSNRMRLILEASREFSESLDLAYVIESVCSTTRTLCGYDRVTVWLMDDDQKGVSEAATVDAEPPRDPRVAWRAAKSGRITSEAVDGRMRFGVGAMDRQAIAIPLIVGARVVGALEARSSEPMLMGDDALEMLEMLATHAATAIQSARLNQLSEERSHLDPLTHLQNRRRLDEDLEAECKRCARYRRPLAFIMLDVDHFKAFNDTLGHPSGDAALQEVADVIASSVRSTDSAYRYGGEEFCILLRETSGASAMVFAERLRLLIEQRFAVRPPPLITASFGVVEFCDDRNSPRALIHAADAAMYESKHAGRNRVTLSSPPPGPPSSESGPLALAIPRAPIWIGDAPPLSVRR